MADITAVDGTNTMKTMKPGDMFEAHKKKVMKKGLGTKIGNAVGKVTGWPGGLNNVSLNRSGTVGTEPISKGNQKYTEIKAGNLGKLDVPMGTLKKSRSTKKKSHKKSENAPVSSATKPQPKSLYKKGLRPASVVVKSEQNASHQMYKKNWIAGAIKKPGALKAELGVKKGNKIPAGKLAAAAKKGGKEGKRARLAQTLKSFHKNKKMTQKEDDAYDRKHGLKEGSKADIKQDRASGIKDKKRMKKSIPAMYQGATKGLQNVGANIAKNVKQGQSDLSSKNMPYYGSINPLKGSVSAFKQGFQKSKKK